MLLKVMCEDFGCGCRVRDGYGAIRLFGLLFGQMKAQSGFIFGVPVKAIFSMIIHLNLSGQLLGNLI